MVVQLAVSLVGVLATAALGVIGWSLRRNVQELDAKITSIATDLRQLSASVAGHENRLGQGDVKISELCRRVEGLEDRERERGCFARCKAGE